MKTLIERHECPCDGPDGPKGTIIETYRLGENTPDAETERVVIHPLGADGFCVPFNDNPLEVVAATIPTIPDSPDAITGDVPETVADVPPPPAENPPAPPIAPEPDPHMVPMTVPLIRAKSKRRGR